MKIALLNNYNYVRGGAERVFLAEGHLMKNHGHAVHIFARRHPKNMPSSYDKFFPKEMVTDSLKPTLKGLGSLLQISYSFDAQKCLSQMIRNLEVDIAHAHNIYGRLTTSILDLLHRRNIPILMTLHDYKLICPNYKLMYNNHLCEDCKGNKFYMAPLNRCHKESFIASTIVALESYFNHIFKKYKKNVQLFISPSSFLLEKLIEFGWAKEQLVHIPNFINTSEFEPLYSPGKYILYIGRLSGEKGLPTLIEAFMKTNFVRAGLTIVGEGPLKKELQEMAAGDSRIRFAGFLSGNRLKETTQNALAVVVPSEWYENAPLSILEAFAFGKLVIGSKIGGIPEMIDHGVNGYLFEPGNKDDLREKLEHVLSMQGKQISEMGEAARRKVETEYNADLHYERLMDVYHRALRKVR